MKNETPKPPVVERLVKHTFTETEQAENGRQLARSHAALRGIETEFDQVKADYKARTATVEAAIDGLATDVQNGFKMRTERCAVIFRTADWKKDFYLEQEYNYATGAQEPDSSGAPVLTEDMTADDFAQELIQAESAFDNRVELPLFTAPEGSQDRGVLVVGQFAEKWFAALRVKIGKVNLDQRLDSEQKSNKNRADAVRRALNEYRDWCKSNLKKEADGFQAGADQLWEVEKGKVE